VEAEIKALESNRTWEIMDLPLNKTLIACKYINKIKWSAYGNIDR